MTTRKHFTATKGRAKPPPKTFEAVFRPPAARIEGTFRSAHSPSHIIMRNTFSLHLPRSILPETTRGKLGRDQFSDDGFTGAY